MKHVIFLLLAATTATAQTITFDTLYYQQVGDKLFQIAITEYDDGSRTEYRSATTKEQVLQVYARQIETDGINIANAGKDYLQATLVMNTAVRLNNILNASLSVRPIMEIQAKYESPFLDTATTTVWQINGQAVTFAKTQTGQLTYKVGSDNAKVVVLIGQLLRLNNYPTQGQNQILFQVRPNIWQDIAGNFTLRRVNLQGR
jgi:hypothetical protein